MKRLFAVLAVLFFGLLGVVLTVKGEDNMSEFYHGTLNLCIGNKNGLVVVTDSRASGQDHAGNDVHEDWHQKLFQVTDKIVVTIAGYNRVPLNKVPVFQAPAAGIILSYVSDLRKKGHEPSYPETVKALTYLMGFYLQSVGSIKELTEAGGNINPENYHLVMLVIGMDGVSTKITKIDIGLQKSQGVESKPYLTAQSVTDETTVNGFEFCAVGQKAIAESFLQQLTSSSKQKERDTLLLDQLIQMAIVIMQKTAERNKYVGGITQVGVFRGGSWSMGTAFPPPPGPYIRFNSVYDAHFSRVGKAIVSGGGVVLVVSGIFEETTVLLGKPYYYFGTRIRNSTVLVEDDDFSFDTTNEIDNSSLVIGEKVHIMSEKVRTLITDFKWKNREELQELLSKCLQPSKK